MVCDITGAVKKAESHSSRAPLTRKIEKAVDDFRGLAEIWGLRITADPTPALPPPGTPGPRS